MDKTWLKFIGPPIEILIGAAIVYYNSGSGGFLPIPGSIFIITGLIFLTFKLYKQFGKKKATK